MITVEKLMILKKTPLFRYTSDEILLELAYQVKEIYLSPNEIIVSKGDFGNFMFLIVEGKVKVHDGDLVLAELGENEVVGELAALSLRERIASVTAIEESLVLKIDHDTLYGLMERHIGLVQGVIEVLCERTRNISADVKKALL